MVTFWPTKSNMNERQRKFRSNIVTAKAQTYKNKKFHTLCTLHRRGADVTIKPTTMYISFRAGGTSLVDFWQNPRPPS